jgi:hypothetical protein
MLKVTKKMQYNSVYLKIKSLRKMINQLNKINFKNLLINYQNMEISTVKNIINLLIK